MTLLATPIPVDDSDDERSVARALEDASCARDRGADLIEWRLDALATSSGGRDAARRLVRESPCPCIVTCRCPDEGGTGSARDPDRLAILAAAATEHPRYVDIEWRTWTRCADAAAIVHGDGDAPGLILSSHDTEGRPADLLQRVEAMQAAEECSVVKIVWTARSLRDGLEAFDLLAQRSKPTIALCMGTFGVHTRLLAPKFGAFLSFAALEDDAATAPGQVTLSEWFDVYRADRVGPTTRVYGIVGWPVAHSLGPDVHNAAFAEAGLDAIYLHLPVAPGYEPFKATVGAMVDQVGLDFAGASVTLPHKEALVRFVRECGGDVEALTDRIGAANTLVVGDRLSCRNTDAPAARAALEAATAIEGRRIVILGAGGAARAVAAATCDAGAHVAILARTPARAEAIVRDLAASDCGTIEAVDAMPEDTAIIVNATPVGMTGGPDPSGSPLPAGFRITPDMVVFDTVYAPERTPLVAEAERAGARVVSGRTMFEAQGVLQRAAWAGEAANL